MVVDDKLDLLCAQYFALQLALYTGLALLYRVPLLVGQPMSIKKEQLNYCTHLTAAT